MRAWGAHALGEHLGPVLLLLLSGAGAAQLWGDVVAVDQLAVLLEDPILAVAQPTLQVLELQVGWSRWEVRGREELVLARPHAGRNFEAQGRQGKPALAAYTMSLCVDMMSKRAKLKSAKITVVVNSYEAAQEGKEERYCTGPERAHVRVLLHSAANPQ